MLLYSACGIIRRNTFTLLSHYELGVIRYLHCNACFVGMQPNRCIYKGGHNINTCRGARVVAKLSEF